MTVKNIVLMIIIIVALVWFIRSVWQNVRIEEIKSWPIVTATVIDSAAETETATFTSGRIYRDHKSIITDETSVTRYFPKVTYKYTVDGKEFQSDSISYPGVKSYDSAEIKNLMIQLSPGNKIPIRYNPNDPRESYIFIGAKSYTSIVVSLMVIAITGGLLYYDGWGGETSQEIKTEFGKITITPGQERKFW